MRPNVDIPWSIHGQIKEYSQQQEITIEEAYIEALELGTKKLPSDSGGGSFAEEQEWLSFGPRLIKTAGEESLDINKVTTFLPHIFHQDLPVTIGTRSRDMTSNELVSSLSSLQSTGYLQDDWFTLHQLGGAKVGRGISNLARTMEEAEELFKDVSFPLYKQGSGIYIAELARDSEYLVVRFELPKQNEVVTNLSLSFVLDGYPVGGKEYYRLAKAFGFDELFNAREQQLPRVGFRFDEPVEVTPVEEITKEGRGDEPWVSSLLIKNPFQEKPKLIEHLEWNEEDEPYKLDGAKMSIDTLQNYDLLYTELDNHHPVSDERDYHLESISAVYLSPLFHRNSVWNISPNVT